MGYKVRLCTVRCIGGRIPAAVRRPTLHRKVHWRTNTSGGSPHIGRALSHDGTDYSKALTVYEYMRENDSGICVNYACQTYEICQGVGLECFLTWTEAGLYGYVGNVVKVEGSWYVLDTQAGCFLAGNYGFTEVIDTDEQHIADGSIISPYSR